MQPDYMKHDVPHVDQAAPKEHGILFSPLMIRAILDGRKSVTRRLDPAWMKVKKRQRLWVRETFRFSDAFDLLKPSQVPVDESVLWTADDDCRGIVCFGWGKKRSPLFMPRWASRITLEATEDARLERLQDITEEDALAEGVERITSDSNDVAYRAYNEESPEPDGEDGIWCFTSAVDSFCSLWSTLHTKPGERWGDAPTVVRIAFRRLDDQR